jgi:hypothetical protein
MIMADKKKKRLPPWLDKNKNGVVDSKEKGKESKSEDKGDKGKGKAKEGKKETMAEAMKKMPWQKGYHPKGK